ncbi:annexin D8-like [Oryza brachyantha]|uniref:annexin D8-like n=1 Tax=Oryza brachyantha TaxID=4533 RepID=UPI0003EACBF7|nr:annexin D8-like [Oryza brachyantha]
MASRFLVTTGFEDECRAIHDACSQPRRLSLLLAHRSPSERQQIKATYRAMFREDLAGELHRILMANEGDELCKLLYLWVLDPAERDAIMARDAVESGGGAMDYRALVEIFTRRKQDQLFFTKQAYLARFKKNLEQDMVTEPSHPYQRLLVALATSHKSHHDELSRHIAKCDARRLYDAKNSSMGSVDEAVILEMFSKRSIPQLRLAFSSYKHIYGYDYTKALKKNGFGEFEQSLRVVVKCIYNPSMYFSKLLHTSLQCSATNRRLVTRAILGSDDVDMDNIKSVFKSSYGKDLEDFIHESLLESDYKEFLLGVAKAQGVNNLMKSVWNDP